MNSLLTLLATASVAATAGGWAPGLSPGGPASRAVACEGPECALVAAREAFAAGRFDAAARALDGVETLGALQAWGDLIRGDALLHAGRAAQALPALRRAAAATGAAALRARPILAEALLAAGDPAGAEAEAMRAAEGGTPESRSAAQWVAAQAARALARKDPAQVARAARRLRGFWMLHPEHPAAQEARDEELGLSAGLPEPTGYELSLRASRLLAAGQPGAAVAQAQAALKLLSGDPELETELLLARALAADGRRSEAAPALERAAQSPAVHVGAPAGLLFARDRARRGQEADAIRLADEVRRRFPDSAEAGEAVLFIARLLLDKGLEPAARRRLTALATTSGAAANAARWQLAWLAWRAKKPEAPRRFAEFAAAASADEDRAQGLYWQARAGAPERAQELYARVLVLDPLGWYGLLARDRMGRSSGAPAPFPPPLPAPASVPDELVPAARLARLGLRGEAAEEADAFVRAHASRASLALDLYRQAGRVDRSLVLAQTLLLRAHTPEVLAAAYPAAYPEAVAKTAARAHFDPYLLLAVMRRESLFKPDARSAAGAVGLLQLEPATAKRAAMVLGRPPLRDAELVEPEVAIDLGGWYLGELLGRFGEAAVAAAAYNAGPGVATPWARAGAGRPLDEWVEDLPYRETRKYVKVVLGAWGAYRELAGGSAPRLSREVPAPRAGAAF